MFRGLRPDEIEVRVGQITQKGASLLLYKDARCDMNILDEAFGTLGWQRDHKEIKGNMFAGVGIFNRDASEWIWKWDCGTESNTEKEKGEASDSFKRACFNLGIGRELYTGGPIFVSCETTKNASNRYELSNKFMFYGAKVSEIEYAETDNKRIITSVAIADKNGKQLYSSNKKVETKKPKAEKPDFTDIPDERVDALLTHADETKHLPVEADQLQMLYKILDSKIDGATAKIAKTYEVADLADLTREQWADAMARVGKIPNKEKK